jgi:hypothetical protein
VKFVQYYLDCLSQASYLIGDETTGRAAVVDPRRDVQDYLDEVLRLRASLLRASAFADVSDLIGGYQAWQAA